MLNSINLRKTCTRICIVDVTKSNPLQCWMSLVILMIWIVSIAISINEAGPFNSICIQLYKINTKLTRSYKQDKIKLTWSRLTVTEVGMLSLSPWLDFLWRPLNKIFFIKVIKKEKQLKKRRKVKCTIFILLFVLIQEETWLLIEKVLGLSRHSPSRCSASSFLKNGENFTPKEHGRHSTLQLLTKHFGYKAIVVLKMTSKASPQTIKKPRAPHLDNVQPRVYNLLMTHCLSAWSVII